MGPFAVCEKGLQPTESFDQGWEGHGQMVDKSRTESKDRSRNLCISDLVIDGSRQKKNNFVESVSWWSLLWLTHESWQPRGFYTYSSRSQGGTGSAFPRGHWLRTPTGGTLAEIGEPIAVQIGLLGWLVDLIDPHLGALPLRQLGRAQRWCSPRPRDNCSLCSSCEFTLSEN